MRVGTAAVAALGAIALSGGGGAAAQDARTSGVDDRGGYHLRAWGQFGTPGQSPAAAAVTYDRELVPAGARIEVEQRIVDGRTTVRLSVSGVQPGHTFGAHVHTDPCGVAPADSGPHYQHVTGEDPALANPANEVWLDLTADEAGAGRSAARQEWTFRPGEARSVVLHERATSTGHEGHHPPGSAGPRAACFSVPFGSLPSGHGARDAVEGDAVAAEAAEGGAAGSGASELRAAPVHPGGSRGERSAAVIGIDGGLPSGVSDQRVAQWEPAWRGVHA
ncbi:MULTISPECIES: superoxide dismutase family protein [unclassified Streptomyces]|uniref:superoxide dismutase family protein n=1 Tax=unclassified Streptomyces TaxID=2593676 RepID=UPI0021560598|nr:MULTISPECIES: superoxide dismutase family protein [unclassified Streptomyces]